MDRSANMLILIDKFLQIYNMKYDKSGSIFEDINIKDPLSTNDKMELFYEYMQDHASLESENKNYTDVYGSNDEIPNENGHDIYALVVGKERKVKYISLSFISLLYIGTQEKGLKSDWSIIML